jgi:hypothetical protein
LSNRSSRVVNPSFRKLAELVMEKSVPASEYAPPNRCRRFRRCLEVVRVFAVEVRENIDSVSVPPACESVSRPPLTESVSPGGFEVLYCAISARYSEPVMFCPPLTVSSLS